MCGVQNMLEAGQSITESGYMVAQSMARGLNKHARDQIRMQVCSYYGRPEILLGLIFTRHQDVRDCDGANTPLQAQPP
jgi:hypothetical protein